MLFLLIICGCSGEKKDIQQEVVSYDPSFQKVLDERDNIKKESLLREQEFRKKQQRIDEQIRFLEQKKRDARKEHLAQLQRISTELDPEVRQLKRDLIDLRRKYRSTAEALENIDRDIREITDLIDKKDQLLLTQEELSTWNSRLESLVQEKQKKRARAAKIKKDIEITGLKIKLLKI